MPAKKQAAQFNPLKTGDDPRGANHENSFLRMEAGEAVEIVPLINVDEILSCEQCAIWLEDGGKSPVWVYIGSDDPSNDLVVQRRYRAYLPVLVDGETKVLAMGKGLHGQFLDIADGIGDIKGANIRVKRTGGGLQTRYSTVAKGTRTDVRKVPEVDIVSMLGPMDKEGIEKLICERLNAPNYEAVLANFKGKQITKRLMKDATTKQRGNHAPMKAASDDEDEDLDDVELS